jgi:hypothetical protein
MMKPIHRMPKGFLCAKNLKLGVTLEQQQADQGDHASVAGETRDGIRTAYKDTIPVI